MTTTMTRLMIAAAALVVAAGSASAQTYRAEVPMTFSASGAVMQPGSYLIREMHGVAPTFYVQNLETKRAVLVVAGSQSDTPKAWKESGDPKIAFACFDDGCALSSLWNGRSATAQQFNYKQSTTLAYRHTEMVTVAMIKVR
ncbi:MAG TPA: hypothetical protein VMH81_18100 [Bryobacteraceae bacterium]|nr:hypothetical protein [Bryobacteraceae bacterium]